MAQPPLARRSSCCSLPLLPKAHHLPQQRPRLSLFAGMNTIVLSSAALGVATARSTQRPTARGFHGVAGGRSQLRIVAQRFSTCRAVAAASSGNGASIQAAAAQAEPALLCLVAAWNSWTAQPMWRVAVVAVSALAAFMVLHSFSKQEIEDRCQYAQAVRQLGGEQVWMPLLALCLRFACSALGAGGSLRRRQLLAAQLTTTMLSAAAASGSHGGAAPHVTQAGPARCRLCPFHLHGIHRAARAVWRGRHLAGHGGEAVHRVHGFRGYSKVDLGVLHGAAWQGEHWRPAAQHAVSQMPARGFLLNACARPPV